MSKENRTFKDPERRIFRAMDSGDDYFDSWFDEHIDLQALKRELFEVWVAGRNAEREACVKIAEDATIEDQNVLEGSEVAKAQHETAMLIARAIRARGESS
jgi:hypothetical protein